MRESPYLWTGSTFEIVRGKDDDHINIQTQGLTVNDARGIVEFLQRWIVERTEKSEFRETEKGGNDESTD